MLGGLRQDLMHLFMHREKTALAERHPTSRLTTYQRLITRMYIHVLYEILLGSERLPAHSAHEAIAA